jgi:hypothetical protein
MGRPHHCPAARIVFEYYIGDLGATVLRVRTEGREEEGAASHIDCPGMRMRGTRNARHHRAVQ